MVDVDAAPGRSASMTWATIEASTDGATAEAVADRLLAEGVTVRIIGPDDWREADVKVPDEPWEVQVPSDAFDRALDALEAWDNHAG
jgi:hypothetical protein